MNNRATIMQERGFGFVCVFFPELVEEVKSLAVLQAHALPSVLDAVDMQS